MQITRSDLEWASHPAERELFVQPLLDQVLVLSDRCMVAGYIIAQYRAKVRWNDDTVKQSVRNIGKLIWIVTS